MKQPYRARYLIVTDVDRDHVIRAYVNDDPRWLSPTKIQTGAPKPFSYSLAAGSSCVIRHHYSLPAAVAALARAAEHPMEDAKPSL